jgi:hypothetical protein
MIWIAPSEKDTNTAALEKCLWDAADQFRANSGLKAQEYSAPVLGLIFLRFAEVRFAAQRKSWEPAQATARSQLAAEVRGPRATHKLTIEDLLDTGLPRIYSRDLYQRKCSAIFEHVYESYPERDTSVYALAS